MTGIAYHSLNSAIARQDKKNPLGNMYQQRSEEYSCFSGDQGATLSTFGKELCTPCGDTDLVYGPGT